MIDVPADELTASVQQLRRTIRGYKSVVVAYSGGVDSSVVLKLAVEELGARALGCIGNSPALPASELEQALAMAAEQQLPVRVIQTQEHLDPNYAANSGDRCFHCRHHLFDSLRELANALKFVSVADGVHADDLADHAGGIAAARRHGIHSPLLEAGLGKAAVRAIARHLQLLVWDKPAMACLASRIPIGMPVTLALLEQIRESEQRLASMGFSDFRVRHHGSVARIELSESDLPRALYLRLEIVTALRAAGYSHVTVDLQTRAAPA